MYQIIFNRRHPEYRANLAGWEKSRAAYSGGEEYIDSALIRHISEIDVEFAERRRRAYYFNYPRAIAQRITQYVFATPPSRHNANADLVEDFDRSGRRTDEVMRQLSTLLNVYGRAWLWVESPSFEGNPSLEEARETRLRPYCRAVSPFDVTDWSFGDDGRLQWAVVNEQVYCNDDPFGEAFHFRRVRLYCRDHWRIFEKSSSGCREICSGENPAGEVPLIPVTEPDGFGLFSRHWFEDVVRISEAILNNESEAQMNVVKQMFGMLVVSDAFFRGARQLAGKDNTGFASTVARSAAIVESAEEKGISRYISPGGVASSVIRSENLALKKELYDVVGLAVQNQSREAQTAESKEWDFQNVCQFLTARADILEQAELTAWKLMNRFDPAVLVPEVTYNRKFAVRDLTASISGLLQLSGLNNSEEFSRALDQAAAELLCTLAPLGSETRNRLFSNTNSNKQ
ncbi:MAG: hypothetical protein IKD29_00605 [Lentisphaeria bacterium]|nr:hypothetical protein [Lentisphaerota bacterium]MBR2631916.1 hypothetical protein [Lentisphaeria bacterium]